MVTYGSNCPDKNGIWIGVCYWWTLSPLCALVKWRRHRVPSGRMRPRTQSVSGVRLGFRRERPPCLAVSPYGAPRILLGGGSPTLSVPISSRPKSDEELKLRTHVGSADPFQTGTLFPSDCHRVSLLQTVGFHIPTSWPQLQSDF